MQVRAEGPLNMRQSGVDNGGIQDTDEGAKDGRHQHPPLIVATETGEWASHPCSRHMKMGTHAFFLSPVSLLPSMIAKQERSGIEAKGILRIIVVCRMNWLMSTLDTGGEVHFHARNE